MLKNHNKYIQKAQEIYVYLYYKKFIHCQNLTKKNRFVFERILIWQKNKRKKSLLSSLRNNFIAGIVVLIPIGITLYLTVFIINISSNLIPKEINPNHYLPYNIPGLEILIAVLLITIIGWISLSFIGKRLFNFFESILNKIPIIRTVYSAVEQLIETFTSSKTDKKTVVLVEYPRKEFTP